ncbi:MAG: sulfatase [Planctomycetes bacterium]|nr:sulfatase [Planctomycetota bacterium]
MAPQRTSGARDVFVRTVAVGGVAGVAVGVWDVMLAAGTQEAPVSAAAPYTIAVTTLAAMGISICVAALLVAGRAFSAASPRMAVLPVGLAGGVAAMLVNRGLFTGPAISQRSWAPIAEVVVGPALGVVATAAVLWIGTCALWTTRRRLLLSLVCVGGFVVFGLANIGYGPFGRFNAYPTLKLELTLLTWLSAFGAVGFLWLSRGVRMRLEAVFAAGLVVAAAGVGMFERGAASIHRVRAQVANLPMPAARQVMSAVEGAFLEWARPLAEITIEDIEVPVLAVSPDRKELARALDARIPNRRRMNVLWLAVDALRQDRLGCYGYRRETTPRIDGFAKDATRFTKALTPTPASAMAYSAVLNGVMSRVSPTYLRVYGVDTPTPDDFSFASVLASARRQTMAVTAFFKATQMRPEFVSMGDGFELFNSDGHIKVLDARGITARVISLLDKRRKFEPFFIFAHYLDPHAPYEFRADHDFGTRPVDAYDSEIAFTDVEIGRLLDELKDRGLADSTIVIIFADHGESFGEHNNWRHGGSLYQHQVCVPLLMRVPGLPGQTVDKWVTLADIGPTTLSLLAVPDPYPRLGRDLAPLMIGADQGWVDFAYADRPRDPRTGLSSLDRGVWSGDRKLLWNLAANTYQLFDLGEDPGEKKNLFDPSDESQRQLLGLMRAFDRRIEEFWGGLAGSEKDVAIAFTEAVDGLEKATPDTAAAAVATVMGVFKTHGLTLETAGRVRAADRDRLRRLAEGALEDKAISNAYRHQIASALMFCDDVQSMDALIDIQAKTRSASVAARISQYRRRHGNPGVATWMRGSLGGTRWDLKLWPAYALATVGDKSGVPFLWASLASPQSNDVVVAAEGLAAVGNRDALLHAMLAPDRFWRQERALAPLVGAARTDLTSTGTAFLIHVASAVIGEAAGRARESLGERLDRDALARSGEVYLAIFGAKEALSYGKHEDALRSLRAVSAKDDALMGPMWLTKLHAALGAGDDEALNDAIARLGAACPEHASIQELVRRLRGDARPFNGELAELPIEAEITGVRIDEKPRPGGVVLLEVDVTNKSDRVIIGGPIRGSLRFGWVERGEKRRWAPDHTFDLPITGIAPGETVRVSAVGRLPKKPGSYDLTLVILRDRVRGSLRELVRLPTVVIDP